MDPLKWLELNKSFLVSSNLILELFRIIGWYIIIGLKALLDECEKLYDTVYSFLDFTQYDTVQNFIKSFQPVYVSLVTLSIIASFKDILDVCKALLGNFTFLKSNSEKSATLSLLLEGKASNRF